MQKKTITTPIYNTVQVGTKEQEVWVTSDGVEHTDKYEADYHEFYTCTLRRRSIAELYNLVDVFIGDIPNEDAFLRVVKDIYSDRSYERTCDSSTFTYPATYAFYVTYDEEESHSYDDMYYQVHCVPVEEYKQLLRNAIDSI